MHNNMYHHQFTDLVCILGPISLVISGFESIIPEKFNLTHERWVQQDKIQPIHQQKGRLEIIQDNLCPW